MGKSNSWELIDNKWTLKKEASVTQTDIQRMIIKSKRNILKILTGKLRKYKPVIPRKRRQAAPRLNINKGKLMSRRRKVIIRDATSDLF